MAIFEIYGEKHAKDFAEKLAAKLKKGDILALIGDLGTGKTTLTKYIASALGINEEITSPTFTIVKEYSSGKLPLYHFDVYRITSSRQMEDVGYAEYFYADGISIVEWADLIGELIPSFALIMEIEKDLSKGSDFRRYTTNFDM